ncbi:hypothetical protein DFP72DRAFT_762261, partial [Ephemerocybe angulata]
INLILSASAPILPLMQFHSTIVQNYIAFHGVVILHQQTLARIGLINLPIDKIPAKTLRCLAKYEQRGFKMWNHLMVDHICNVDPRCAQTTRSLFDDHITHFKFPDFQYSQSAVLRQNEATIMHWRSRAANACESPSTEKHGFFLCNE